MNFIKLLLIHVSLFTDSQKAALMCQCHAVNVRIFDLTKSIR